MVYIFKERVIENRIHTAYNLAIGLFSSVTVSHGHTPT